MSVKIGRSLTPRATTGDSSGRTRSITEPSGPLVRLEALRDHAKNETYQHFFREAGARYDLARPGSLRVCPPDSHVAQIRSDYRDMREMFFGETPPFDQIIADLKELEDQVNS